MPKFNGNSKRVFSAWTAIFLILQLINPSSIFSLPTNYEVESGDVTFEQTDNNLTITASDQAVINFQSFSIAENETVQFIQPNELSSVLANVVGTEESHILGSLLANGMVVLINPNGIYFSESAHVETGSLIAATLELDKAMFLNNEYSFQKNPNYDHGKIVNDATIAVRDGGNIVLIAESIVNNGSLQAKLGSVQLGAGEKATLNFDGQGLISLVIDEGLKEKILNDQGQPVPLIENNGAISATGGAVRLDAQMLNETMDTLINNTGVIEAQGFVEHDGVIELVSNGTIMNAETGVIHATVLNETGYTFKSPGTVNGGIDENGKIIKGAAFFDNIDGAADLPANIGSDVSDTGDLNVGANVAIDVDNVVLTADSDGNGVGNFTWTSTASTIDANSNSLTIIAGTNGGTAGANITLGTITELREDGDETNALTVTSHTGTITQLTDKVLDANDATGYSVVLTAEGNIIVEDIFTNSAALVFGSVVVDSNNGTITRASSGNLIIGFFTQLSGNSIGTLAAPINFYGGGLTFAGVNTGSGGGVYLSASSGGTTLYGWTVENTSQLTATGNIVFEELDGFSDHNFTQIGGSSTFDTTGNISVTDPITAATGTLTFKADGDININENVSVAGSNIVMTADDDNNNAGSFSMADGKTLSTTTSGNITIVADDDSTVEDVTSAGTLSITIDHGSLTETSSDHLLTGTTVTLDANSIGTTANNINVSGTTLNVTADATSAFIDGADDLNLASASITGSILELGGSATFTLTNALSLSGKTLTIADSGTTVDLEGQNLTLGTLTNNGTLRLRGNETTVSITNMDTNSGMVFYDGTADYTGETNLKVGSSYYDLKFDGINGAWSTDNVNLTVNGDFTLNNGTFTSGLATNVTGAYTQNGGTFNGGASNYAFGSFDFNAGTFNSTSGTLQFNNNSDFTGTGTFNHNNGTIQQNSDGDADDIVSFVPAGAAFNHVNFYYNDGSSGLGDTAIWVWSDFSTAGDVVLTHNNSTFGADFTPVGTRTITIGGNLSIPSTAETTEFDIGNSNFTFDLNGATSSFSMAEADSDFNSNLKFSGNGTGTLTQTAGDFLGSIIIDKSGGSISLGAELTSGGANGAQTFTMTNGTFDQNSWNMRWDTGDFVMNGGTYNGSTGATFFYDFDLNSGIFNATTGTTSAKDNADFTGTATYNHNNGIFRMIVNDGTSKTFTPAGYTFYGFTVTRSDSTVQDRTLNIAGNFSVLSDVDLENNEVSAGTADLNIAATGGTRTINVSGDVLIPSTAANEPLNIGSSSLVFNLSGASSDFSIGDSGATFSSVLKLSGATGTQTISRTAGNFQGNIEVDKASGEAQLATALTVGGTSKTLTITNGAFDLNGFDLSYSNAATMSNDGIFRLQGAEILTNLTLDTNSGTMEYDGAGNYSSGLILGDSYQHLTISGLGSWTLDNTLTLGGSLSLSGGTLDVSNLNNYGVSVAGDWSNSGGTFNAQNGIVTLNGSGSQTISGSNTFYSLSLSTRGSGTVGFTGSTNITGALTAPAGAYVVSLTGSSNTITNAATFSNTGGVTFGDGAGDVNLFNGGLTSTASTTTVMGALRSSADTMALGAVTLGGDATIDTTNNGNSATGAGLTLGAVTGTSDALTVSSGTDGDTAITSVTGVTTLTVTQSDDTTVSGTTDATTITLTDTDNAITFGGNVTATTLNTANQGYSAVFNGSSNTVTNAATFSNTGGVTLGDGAGDVNLFDGGLTSTASTTTVQGAVRSSADAMTFGAVSLSGTSAIDTTNNGGSAAGANLNFNSTLDGTQSLGITAGNGTATFSGAVGNTTRLGDFTINSGAATFSNVVKVAALSNAGTINAGSSDWNVSGNWTNTGTFNPNNGEIIFDGGVGTTQTLNSGGSNFYDLTHSGAGTLRLLTNNLTVADAFTNSAGTFDADTNDRTTTVTGLAEISGGTYLASSSATQTFNNELRISGGVFTGSSGNVDINGIFNMSAGTFTAPTAASTFTVSDDFLVIGGTFTHSSGKVIFDTTTEATLNAPLAGLSFWDFESTAAGKTFKFTAGDTFNILAPTTFTIQGAANNLITMDSTVNGSQFNINAANYNVSFAQILNSNNMGAGPVNPANSMDGGNTTNWFSSLSIIQEEQPEVPINEITNDHSDSGNPPIDIQQPEPQDSGTVTAGPSQENQSEPEEIVETYVEVNEGVVNVGGMDVHAGEGVRVNSKKETFLRAKLAYVTTQEGITVIRLATNEPHRQIYSFRKSSRVVANSKKDKAYVTQPESQSLGVIDGITMRLNHTIQGFGEQPDNIILSHDGNKAYVANYKSDTISIVDLETNLVIDSIPTGSAPYGMTLSPDSRFLFVTNHLDRTIIKIDLLTKKTVMATGGPKQPFDLAMSLDGKEVFVTDSASDQVYVFQADTLSLSKKIKVGSSPNDIKLTPDGKSLFTSNRREDTVSVIDTQSGTETARVPVGQRPAGMDVTPDGETLYVANQVSGNVSKLDIKTHKEIAQIKTGAVPSGVAVSYPGILEIRDRAKHFSKKSS